MTTDAGENQPLDIVRMLRAHMAKEAERLSTQSDKRLLALQWEYQHDSRDRDAVEPIDEHIHDWLFEALAVLDE